jgi:oligopeptide transport system permease protein
LAVVGAIIIISIALASIIVPLISPYEFDEQNLNAVLEGPSSTHLLGTDGLGRDVFTRLFYGARTSLAVGVFTQLIVLAIGLPIGALAGYAGGRVDNLLMRFVDIVYAFPDLLLIILIRAILGGSIYMIFLAIGLVAWVNVARLVRGQILTLKQRDFATAARAMGGSGPYITLRHLLPNSLGPVIVLVTFGVPRAIFAEAALSYIGIGVQPPTPSWGTMILDGYNNIFGAPYLVLFPAIAVGILMLAFTFLGDGLRDALDPRERR